MVDGPIRTCVGCREQKPQNRLIRLARRPDGSVVLDLRHRAGGRGAYVCSDEECAANAVDSGRLHRALRLGAQFGAEVRAELLQLIDEKP